MPTGLGPAAAGHRPAGGQRQVVLASEGAQGSHSIGAVQVQHVEAVAGGQADVGLGVAGPPGQHPRPIGRRLPHPMRDEGAEGMLADLPARPIPTRAAAPYLRGDNPTVARGAGASELGDRVMQRQHRNPAAGVAEGGVA
jgi:hypothetical protein